MDFSTVGGELCTETAGGDGSSFIPQKSRQLYPH